MVKNVRFGAVMTLVCAMGCGGPSEATGGASGSGTKSGGPGGASASSGGTGGAATTIPGETTTTGSLECALAVDPMCDYPDLALSYDSESTVYDLFAPIPGWETNGASEGCAGPMVDDLVIGRVVVGFTGTPLPWAVSARVQVRDDLALDDIAPDYTGATYESEEEGPDSTVLGVYTLPESMLALKGKFVCVALPLAEHTPVVMHQGECEDHRRTRWLGLPVNGEPMLKPPAEQLTWAYLACPLDTTTDDGTPSVEPYFGDFLRGVRE